MSGPGTGVDGHIAEAGEQLEDLVAEVRAEMAAERESFAAEVAKENAEAES